MAKFNDPNLTPEQRRAMRAKSQATRDLRRAEKLIAASPEKAGELLKKLTAEGLGREPATTEPAPPPPRSLADLGLVAKVDPDEYELPEEEKERIRAEVREQVKAEKKAKVSKAYKRQALEDARRAAGTLPASVERQQELDELTTITINVPRMRGGNGRDLPPEPIIIDQKLFLHGYTYTVPRGQAEYITYLQARMWEHCAQVDGRSKTYYSGELGRVLWNGQAPAAGGGGGPSFDSIHRRPA